MCDSDPENSHHGAVKTIYSKLHRKVPDLEAWAVKVTDGAGSTGHAVYNLFVASWEMRVRDSDPDRPVAIVFSFITTTRRSQIVSPRTLRKRTCHAEFRFRIGDCRVVLLKNLANTHLLPGDSDN